MPTLSIDLQNGFSDDVVIVRVDGIEILRKSGVTTNLASSLAESRQVETEGNPVQVEVAVPSRDLKGTIELDVLRTPYLGISLTEGRLEFNPSEAMFFYL